MTQPLLPEDSRQSVGHAKRGFLEVVRHAISELRSAYGYSHERAVAALLREISRDVAARPQTAEMFQLMQSKGYGLEETQRILTIEKAVDSLLQSGRSQSDAILALTNRISLANLLDESHDDDENSTETASLPSRAGTVRIEPTAIQPASHAPTSVKSYGQKPAMFQRKSKGMSRTPSKTKISNTAKVPTKHPAAGRKRSIEEVAKSATASTGAMGSRSRADSVAEEIDAKVIATQRENTSVDVPGSSTRPKRPTDSASTGSNTTKRIRSGETSRNAAPTSSSLS